MKSLSVILVILSVTLNLRAQPSASDFSKLKWLEGTWVRTNNRSGRTATETWKKNSARELAGFGVTLQGNDTVFVEKLKLVIENNKLYYVADVAENAAPVYFTITSISESGFVCENPQHDFPKKISYRIDGKTLKAEISGDGKSVDYIFEKK